MFYHYSSTSFGDPLKFFRRHDPTLWEKLLVNPSQRPVHNLSQPTAKTVIRHQGQTTRDVWGRLTRFNSHGQDQQGSLSDKDNVAGNIDKKRTRNQQSTENKSS